LMMLQMYGNVGWWLSFITGIIDEDLAPSLEGRRKILQTKISQWPFLPVFTVWNVIYDTYFFSLCSYFHSHPTTLLLKIFGGGRMHGPSPTSNFGGLSPQPHLNLRPWPELRRFQRLMTR